MMCRNTQPKRAEYPRIVVLVIVLVLSGSVRWPMTASGAPDAGIPPEDRSLVERSGEIFVGTIDIVTRIDASSAEPTTRYTVLIDEVIKGALQPVSMVVVEQTGVEGAFADGDAALIPHVQYLLFTSYIPGDRIYRITEPVIGNLAWPVVDVIAYWSRIADETGCRWSDVLWMDGIAYQRRQWNDGQRYLRREWVGKSIARVRAQDTAANACRNDVPDLTATSAPAGTAIQLLKGYDPTFRVVLRLPDGHRYLYEAIRNDAANEGADLLGIDERVVSIEAERWHECDDIGGPDADCDSDVRITSTDNVIETVVDLVLDAPAIVDRIDLYDGVGKYLRLRFELDDGSTVEIAASLTSGLTVNGLELPVDGLQLMLWGEPL